jgi:eukaryotic-like serine/threonine-protein kinase
MGVFYFLGQKKFYIHLLIAILLMVVMLWLVLTSLDSFTRHGDVYIVPDFSGMTMSEMEEKQYDDFFTLEIIDSVYNKNMGKGEVITQSPLSGSKVKAGRHIYLTIVSEKPESVMMPNLKNLSLRQALVTLEVNDLQVGELIYVDYFAMNAIVEQLEDGQQIEPGKEILKGTTIDLQVGKGTTSVSVAIPMLIGKRMTEAEKAIHYSYLNVGNEYFIDGRDTVSARVFKTNPTPLTDKTYPLGQKVEIWYRSDQLFDFDAYLLEILADTLAVDSIANQKIIEQGDEF